MGIIHGAACLNLRAAVVTNCDEASLRAAMAGGGTVTFACDGTITLTNTITATTNTVLDGTGHSVKVSGGNTVPVFSVNAGVEFTLVNLTVGDGGGTYLGAGLFNAGATKLVNCTFSNNVARGSPAFGGAIYQSGGRLMVNGCTFVGNRAVGTNSATSFGGAIASGYVLFSGPIAITNSTFVGNSATSGGAIYRGCGPGSTNGPVTVVNCSFAENSGYALANCSFSSGAMLLLNTVLVSNSPANGSAVTDGGHNLSSDASGNFTHPFSLESIDPRLGLLTNNGGPTLTMSLLADSPAIDAGNDSAAPAVDQRGVSRPAGFYSDIGAYEAAIAGFNAGLFQIGATTNAVTEANTNLLVSVVRAGGLAGTVSVNFSTSSGTASAGSDYMATNGTVVFAAGQHSNSFIVPLFEDEIVEGTETFSLELSNPTGGAALGRVSPAIMILDNDASFQFLSINFSMMETNGSATITVTRLGDTNNTGSVNYATSNGTALAGSDYLSASGILNFARGQTSATFSVSIQEDSLAESNETVQLMLTNPGSGTVLGNPNTAALTITDNDPIPPLRFSSANYSVSEGVPEVTLTLLFGHGADHSVSVNFATSDGTAVAGSDYVTTNGTLTFAPSETAKWFKIQLFDNTPVEGNEAFAVTLSGATGGATLGSPSAAMVTIIDALQTVQTCDEATLRAAVSAGGRVALACDGTIGLTSPLVISNGVSLDASGHNVSISGSNATRLFIVEPGVALTLRGLGLSDGLARGTNSAAPRGTGGTGVGGAICNNGGFVSAADCLFLRNTASGGIGGPPSPSGSPGAGGHGRGGAIFNTNGHVIASNCMFAGNVGIGGSAGTNGIGFALGGDADGGVISTSAGSVQFINCVFMTNNVTPGVGRRFGIPFAFGSGITCGGAIFSLGADVTLQNVRLINNSALNGNGGAICQSGGAVNLTTCILDGNRARGRGGGIHSSAGVTRLTNVTLSGNVVHAGDGGSAFGGGIFNTGDLKALNCTLAGNSALGGGYWPGYNAIGYGGGIYNSEGICTLTHATLAFNSAVLGGISFGTDYEKGGAIFSTNGMVTLRNTILAHSPSGSNCFGTLTDAGHNLSSDASCDFTAPGSLNNTDPKLGPLADYGGPTPTMALSAGSPAIDAANSAWCLPTDQRGIARPHGAGCDIGAFESAPPYTILGYIRGYLSPAGIALSAGGPVATPDPTGLYTIHGLTPGSYTVTPSASDVIFVLSNHVCSVGPDVVNADFHSYRSNAWTVVSRSNNIISLVFAGATGQTYQVLASSNLTDWLAFSTNVTPASGILEFNEVADQRQRFLKALQP